MRVRVRRRRLILVYILYSIKIYITHRRLAQVEMRYLPYRRLLLLLISRQLFFFSSSDLSRLRRRVFFLFFCRRANIINCVCDLRATVASYITDARRRPRRRRGLPRYNRYTPQYTIIYTRIHKNGYKESETIYIIYII